MTFTNERAPEGKPADHHDLPPADGHQPDLSAQHLALIRASAISSDVMLARGYRTVTARSELRRLGFSDNQCRVPALLVPIWNVSGEIATYQIRPDQPRAFDGKALKYETPKGSRMVIDVPRGAREALGDPCRPLFITEGARKADAAVTAGLCCIALLGVWNWRGKNDQGGLTVLADWESIAIKGREIIIAFDSDVVAKAAVRAALERLRAFLEQRGARVRVLLLPADDGGRKVGLDDFLASGKTKDDLLACATIEHAESEKDAGDECLYAATEDGRILYNKPLPSGGYTPIVLSNFTAQILAEIVVDDGVETWGAFQLQGSVVGKPEVIFEVPAENFAAMNWPIEHLGAKATIAAGLGSRDRLREAIQRLSPDTIPRSRVYTHIGFRRIDDKWVYLHGGGGIGVDGPVAGIRVRLDPPLDRFVLPAPPDGDELIKAVRTSFGLLNGLVSDRVMFPLFSAAYTAPLGDTNESVHLFGKTGGRKTETCALIQRHYGESMGAEHLPGSWTSTSNAQEALAFLAKDAVLVIDDFNPTGGVHDIRRAHANADRIFRAQGNGSARQRMDSRGSLRPPKPPRGLIVSTGEEVPAGHSLRARVLLLEMCENEINLERLTECQKDATHYSHAMSAYVRWMAPRRDDLRKERDAFVIANRLALFAGASHGRTATIGASLLFGLVCALRFARDSGALEEPEVALILERGRVAIASAVAGQAQHHEAAEPLKIFGELLSDALQSGAAHLADRGTGNVPESAELARLIGWRLAQSTDGLSTRTEWRPGGPLIGWLDAEKREVFLLPQASYDAAQRMADSSPTRITVGHCMLAKALDEAGELVTRDHGGRRTKKIRVGDHPRNAWHVRLSYLFGAPGTEGTTGTSPNQEERASSGWAPLSSTTVPTVPAVPTAADTGGQDEIDREGRPGTLEQDDDVPRAAAEHQAGFFDEPIASRDPEASGSVGEQ